jgi:aspartate racemase
MEAVAEKIIGVLGGMGPESSADLLVRITRATPARVEQDHLRVILDSNPKIPNRTDALLSGELEPVIAALVDTAKNLQKAGAQVIGIPCNTAHAFLDDLRRTLEVPIVDMVGETAREAGEEFGPGAVVGLLATDGTLRTRLYHEALDRVGLIGVAPPTPGVQHAVMDALDTVKLHGPSQEAYQVLAVAIRDLVGQEATALIAGCTEVSLVLQRFQAPLRWLDPLQVLAEALVREALDGQ